MLLPPDSFERWLYGFTGVQAPTYEALGLEERAMKLVLDSQKCAALYKEWQSCDAARRLGAWKPYPTSPFATVFNAVCRAERILWQNPNDREKEDTPANLYPALSLLWNTEEMEAAWR